MSNDKHFDTFETDFFQQGEDSASLPVEVERFDDFDESGRRRRGLFSRQSLIIAGACVAVLGCAVLWRGNSHASPPAVAMRAETIPTVAPSPDKAEKTPAEPAPLAAATQVAEEIPVKPSPEPAPLAAATQVAEELPVKPSLEPAPLAAAKQVAEELPVKPSPEPVRPLAPAAQAVPNGTQERCHEAIRGKRNKDILALCPATISDDPDVAAIAVSLARIEFDRGRSAQASAWSKKAIAANPDVADAYVFLGGAEQNAGHGKAAKQAYQHYLRLAPSGRYAADLRAIVNSL
jgi:tetratricopeptide (TPR) repeat protein